MTIDRSVSPLTPTLSPHRGERGRRTSTHRGRRANFPFSRPAGEGWGEGRKRRANFPLSRLAGEGWGEDRARRANFPLSRSAGEGWGEGRTRLANFPLSRPAGEGWGEGGVGRSLFSPGCGERGSNYGTMRLLSRFRASVGGTRLLPSPRAGGAGAGVEGMR